MRHGDTEENSAVAIARWNAHGCTKSWDGENSPPKAIAIPKFERLGCSLR